MTFFFGIGALIASWLEVQMRRVIHRERERERRGMII